MVADRRRSVPYFSTRKNKAGATAGWLSVCGDSTTTSGLPQEEDSSRKDNGSVATGCLSLAHGSLRKDECSPVACDAVASGGKSLLCPQL